MRKARLLVATRQPGAGPHTPHGHLAFLTNLVVSPKVDSARAGGTVVSVVPYAKVVGRVPGQGT